MRLYGGIKEGYPILRKYSQKLAILGQLIRPATLIAPFIAGLFGVMLPIVYELHYFPLGFIASHFKLVTLVIIALMGVQGVGQVVNQICDVEIDKINKPYRPLVRGDISVREAWSVALFLIAMTLVSSYLINLPVFSLMLIGLFLAIFYSLEPIRVKKRHWFLGLTWQALARGFLPFLIVWGVFGKFKSMFVWWLAFLGFSWVLAFQGTKDFSDYEGDRKFNISTIVTRFGYDGAIEFITYMGLLPIIISTIIAFLFTKTFLLVSLILALLYMTIIYSLVNNVSLEKFENNLAWLLFYFGLGTIYITSTISFTVI